MNRHRHTGRFAKKMRMLQLLQKAINEKKKAAHKRIGKKNSSGNKSQFVQKMAKQHHVHKKQMNQY